MMLFQIHHELPRLLPNCFPVTDVIPGLDRQHGLQSAVRHLMLQPNVFSLALVDGKEYLVTMSTPCFLNHHHLFMMSVVERKHDAPHSQRIVGCTPIWYIDGFALRSIDKCIRILLCDLQIRGLKIYRIKHSMNINCDTIPFLAIYFGHYTFWTILINIAISGRWLEVFVLLTLMS